LQTWTKEALNRRRRIFCGPLEKELRKRLVKCFVWSVALYGEGTWTLRRNEEKRIEAFEMWMWRRTVRVKWTDKIRNKIVFEKTIRNSAQLSGEICENENPEKRRKVEGIQTRVAAAKEVCDLIITQANIRFQFIDHLILSSLLCQEKFECYKSSFPENDLKVCVKLFLMFDKDKLKTELTVLYQRQEFRNISDAVKLLQFLLSENLQASFSEVVKLLRIAITIPMTTSEPKRCFSCLKRVKSYLRNTMREERLTALAMFSIVKTINVKVNDLTDPVEHRIPVPSTRKFSFLKEGLSYAGLWFPRTDRCSCWEGISPLGSRDHNARATYKHQVLCFVTQNSCRDLRLLEEAYGEAAMKKTQVYAWHKRFSGGRDSIKDDVRSGRPTTATNEAIAQRVHNVVRDDRRKTIKEIAAEVGISVGSVHDVLHKHLNMHYVSQKLVPKMLSAEQKETRMTLAGDMISIADEDGDFLNKIIAGDETWCYLYDPVPKRQSSEWKSKTSPRKQKFPRDTSKGKVMLEVFFDSQGLIHHEFIPEGRTVTKELYVEILRRFRDVVRRKRPEKWVENNWFLMHDNAPAHRAFCQAQHNCFGSSTILS
ncbi:hypothetical protein ANN_00411, partial [Periplaneta americana]